jgi:L-ascorbate metabolism protein UlaG (beta-lactamase superfamily)
MKKIRYTFLKALTLIIVLFGVFCSNSKASEILITYIYHDGFIIQTDNKTIYTDMIRDPGETAPIPDVIFISHTHGDHFNPELVIQLANASGAVVVGTQPAISRLNGDIPNNQLITFAPANRAKVTGSVSDINLIIYGSRDGTAQNSYRFEFPSGATVYHNGDMPGGTFRSFVSSNNCPELLNMNIAMVDEWAWGNAIEDFNNDYQPDVMIKMHTWTTYCEVFIEYPTYLELTGNSTYAYTGYSSIFNKDEEKNNQISVFPNPAKNSISIKNIISPNASIEILDLTGKTVLKKQIDSNPIYISSLSKGIYFLKVYDDGGIRTNKFIKD